MKSVISESSRCLRILAFGEASLTRERERERAPKFLSIVCLIIYGLWKQTSIKLSLEWPVEELRSSGTGQIKAEHTKSIDGQKTEIAQRELSTLNMLLWMGLADFFSLLPLERQSFLELESNKSIEHHWMCGMIEFCGCRTSTDSLSERVFESEEESKRI